MRLTRNSLKARLISRGKLRVGANQEPGSSQNQDPEQTPRRRIPSPDGEDPQNESDSSNVNSEDDDDEEDDDSDLETDKIESCATCGAKKISPQKIDLNSSLLLFRTYVCTICDYKCFRAQSLIIHIRTHTGEKPFSCTICDYKSSTSSALTIHKRTHTGEKPFSCPLCDYKCISSSYLIKHRKSHALKKYCCTNCNKKFTTLDRLTKHTRSNHKRPARRCATTSKLHSKKVKQRIKN